MRKSTIFALATAFVASAGMFSANAEWIDVDYTLDPAPGIAGNLSEITISFPEDNVVFYENTSFPVAVLTNNETNVEYICTEPSRVTRVTDAMTAWKLEFVEAEDPDFSAIITEPGNYTLTVKSLVILEGIGEDDAPVYGDDVNVITVDYTIDYPIDYNLNPGGETAEDLQNIVLTFPNNKVDFYEVRPAVATLENTTTGSVYYCATPDINSRAMTEEGCEYTLVFVGEEEDDAPASITEPGNYTLTIRGAYLPGEENTDLPAITANYFVYPNYAYTLTPAEGTVDNLKTVVLDFTSNKNVDFYTGSPMPVAVLENVTTGAVYNCYEPDRNPRPESDGAQFSFTFIGEDDEEAMDITAEGNYNLTIRAMYAVLDEGDDDNEAVLVDLPVINAVYTIEYPVEYSFQPEGDVATDLMTVVLTFPNNKVDFYEARPAVGTLENTTTGVVYTCEFPDFNSRAMTENGCEYSFTFLGEDAEEAAPIVEAGNYTLTVRGAYLPAASEDSDNIDLPVIVKNYTIFSDYSYVLNPEEGLVEELQGLTIEFPETKAVAFYENNRAPVAVLENLTTGAVYTCQEPDRDTFAETEGILYTFNFVGEDDEVAVTISEAGNYLLTIRAMYAEVVNGEDEDAEITVIDLPVITASYTIYPDFTYVLTPAPGDVENISTISLEFPQTKNVAFFDNNRMPIATLELIKAADENAEAPAAYYCYEADTNTKAESNGVVYSLTFEAEGAEDEDGAVECIDVEGEYVLTIRAMYAEVEGEQISLPVISENYVIMEGAKVAEVVAAENGVYNVYTVNGVQVVKNGEASSLNGLAKGLYIINGKKVIVTK